MSDGISEMWYQYEEYKKLCLKLGIESLKINDNWLEHFKTLENND